MLTQSTKTGLIEALKGRSNKLRRTMLEVALIDGINDSDKEAQLLARFARSIMVGFCTMSTRQQGSSYLTLTCFLSAG